MKFIATYKPISQDLFLKITLLKSMMYCGVLWGLYQDGWAMTRDQDDAIFPFWLSPVQAEKYAKQHWPNYTVRKIHADDFNHALLPTLERLEVIPALYTSKNQTLKLTPLQMTHFFFSAPRLHFS